jgi:hypothetical protein
VSFVVKAFREPHNATMPRLKITAKGHAELSMPRKKKIRRFRAVTAVKELARERIGTPPPTQVVPDRKKRTQEKHKPTLGKLLEDS